MIEEAAQCLVAPLFHACFCPLLGGFSVGSVF
jgi:hypothetical protein